MTRCGALHPRWASLMAAMAFACWLPGLAPSAEAIERSTPTSGMRVLELAIEAHGAALTLPMNGFGKLTVAPCRDCQPLSLLTGSGSRFFVDGTAVDFEALRRTLLAEPDAIVAVFYRRTGGEVTRILVTRPTPRSGP